MAGSLIMLQRDPPQAGEESGVWDGSIPPDPSFALLTQDDVRFVIRVFPFRIRFEFRKLLISAFYCQRPPANCLLISSCGCIFYANLWIFLKFHHPPQVAGK
jgi:hypothetical protein